MMSAIRIAAPLAAIFLSAPVAALAQNAIMSDDAALRAGPGSDFPRVAYVPEDARVYINGCLRGFTWCDISWRGERGWVDASNLSYSWNNRYVIVEDWGPRIGLPTIAFSVQDYWTRHYRDRPWWSQRSTWFERDRRWRDGDRWRDRNRGDRGDRQRRDRDEWRDRQRDDRGMQDRRMQERRMQEPRMQERDQWRGGQRGDRDGQRGQDRDNRRDDAQRFQQRQRSQDEWRQRGGMNGQSGQRGSASSDQSRRFDNAPSGRSSQPRQQRGDDRM